MLLEAIELQQNAVKSLINQISTKNEITFKAPTGSGKTFMMADFMSQVLSKCNNVIFLVSTLSKGDLAKQNFDKFTSYISNGKFTNIKPYLINTNVSSEGGLFIPLEYNVYLLPRDLFKSGGKLMQGAMENFLNTITFAKFLGGCEKKIFLIKDECHIATKNLDSISNTYFEKVINFSATPNLKRRQNPDVEISDDDAVNAKLIKKVIVGDDEDTINDAINKFEEIKDSYRNLLGVNPCLIIQISNKDKADYELNNIIFPTLNRIEHQHLKWMLIVDKEINCDTNDVFKAKKLPVKKWKDYAKENTSSIDIIIFKMVVSEGWDIPRACMLYQVRETQSEQLDEQVIGRVRRNPRLLDFEFLPTKAQELATTAWIWGIMPEEKRKIYNVKLWDEPEDIINKVRIKTTSLKPLTKKTSFDIDLFIKNQPNLDTYISIFEMNRKLNQNDFVIKNMCYEYSDSYDKWFSFNKFIDKIKQENDKFICNYSESMEITKDENNNLLEKSFPTFSSYVDDGNYVNISDWVWKRQDGKDKFSFDSEAEREWATILKDLSSIENSEGKRLIEKVETGKTNPDAGKVDIFTGEIHPNKLNPESKFLWGKNYILNSEIKFEYYLNGIHSSFPDFILKDCYNRIHLFEVKSVNLSNKMSSGFDSVEYKLKVAELKKCYLQASLLTESIFYLPVLKEDTWYITQLYNGKEKQITKEQFIDFIKNNS